MVISNSLEMKEFSSSSIDEIFASVNLLRKIKDVTKYQKWLKEYHNVDDFTDYFEGYKIFIYSLLMKTLEGIMFSDLPYLHEDLSLIRVKNYLDHPFYPFPEPNELHEIPNTCNKIVLLKIVLQMSNGIRKANEIKTLKEKIEKIDEFIKLIFHIFNNMTTSKNSEEKKILLKVKSCEFINEHFNQMLLFGYPMDDKHYTVPLAFNIVKYFELKNLTNYYKGKMFKGYLFTLQYSWFCLIGKKTFLSKKISKLNHLIDEELKQILQDKDYKNIKIKKYWRYIDDRFSFENDNQIIKPLTKKLTEYDSLETGFKIVNNDTAKFSKLFERFLKSEILDEPDFISRNDDESIVKQLDYEFTWLPMEIIGFPGEASFYGAKTFITFLKGMIANFESFDDGEKMIRVKVINHSSTKGFGKKGRGNYSFAFLPAYDRNYYRSGWILFHRCFDGTGDNEGYFEKFFEELETLSKNDSIVIEELNIDYSKFSEYISNRCISFYELRNYKEYLPKKPIVEALLKDEEWIMPIIKTQQSRIFEDMVRKWLRENENLQVVETGYYVSKGNNDNDYEIDIIVRLDDSHISLYECKIELREHNIEEEKIIQRTIEKAELLIKKDEKFRNNSYSNFIVVWNEVHDNERRKLFEENNIQIIDNFKKIIAKLPNFRNEKQSVVNFFDMKRLWANLEKI